MHWSACVYVCMYVWMVCSYDYYRSRSHILNVEKYEKDGSLVIVDSFEAYSRESNNNSYNIVSLFKLLLQQAEIFDKKGICIISDLGPFYQFQRIEELIKHERSFPRK